MTNYHEDHDQNVFVVRVFPDMSIDVQAARDIGPSIDGKKRRIKHLKGMDDRVALIPSQYVFPLRPLHIRGIHTTIHALGINPN